jgi:hypothetical protein
VVAAEREPTPRFTAATAWEFITGNMLLRGDGFARHGAQPRRRGEEVIPVPWATCATVREGSRSSNSLYATIDLFGDDKPIGLDQDDVLHFPGFGFNGLRSMSSSGGRLPGDRHGARDGAVRRQHDANGAMQKIALVTPADMNKEQIDKLRDSGRALRRQLEQRPSRWSSMAAWTRRR